MMLENGSIPETFFGLLEAVRDRPLMILGERSLHSLWVFLLGYRYARAQQGLPLSHQEQQFEEFGQWVHEIYRDVTTQSWATVIQSNQQSETEAWDRFFALLAEFRQNNRAPMATSAAR